MKTYKLTNEKEIKVMLFDVLHTDLLEDMALTMRDYFLTKAKDLTAAITDKEKEEFCRAHYNIFGDAEYLSYEARLALSNLETVTHWLTHYPDLLNVCIRTELEQPTTIEYDDDDEPEIGEFVCEFDNRWREYFLPYQIMNLYDETYGMREDEYVAKILKDTYL